MTKNNLLNIAVVLCKGICFLYIIVFLVFTAFFIHFQISPDTYKEASFDSKNSSFQIKNSSTWKIEGAGETVLKEKDVFALDKISKASFYFIYLQYSAVLIFIFLSVKEFQKIIQSVKSLKTFQKNNVTSFRKIGKYILIVFLLTSYTSIQFQQGGKSEISLSFTPLLFMLIAFIMAEIFKEGNSLQQENDLTI